MQPKRFMVQALLNHRSSGRSPAATVLRTTIVVRGGADPARKPRGDRRLTPVDQRLARLGAFVPVAGRRLLVYGLRPALSGLK